MAGIVDHEDDASEMSSPEDEQLLPQSEGQRRAIAAKSARKRFATAATLGAAAIFGCLAAATLRIPAGGRRSQLRAPPPLTVRSLLEGGELADVATDNVLAFSGEELRHMGREGVRASVAQGLQNISEAIRTKLPEVHQELETVQLSAEQKDSALHVLRKFGDPRMVSLTRDINAVVAESPERGDVQRRLSDRIGSKAGALRELAEEMFPNKQVAVDMDQELPGFEGWHPQLEVDFSAPAARRLAAAGEGVIGAGVVTQARTLFGSLHGVLGDKLSPAHSRQLMSLFSDTASNSASSGGKQGFMDCVMKAVPNPMSVAKCIAENMGEVMSMMSRFVKGKR
mmetsp:Transcript_127940/g.368605  ORF Transcript_127940/g.368605 Transcript_127940/m.368605 type:complete len:340 (-) Transcript_127940:109-1128(-)